MKKIEASILMLIMLLGISSFCYADVVYMSSAIDVAFEVIGEYTELVGNFYIIIPLIILYGILIKVILKRNKEKSKKSKIVKCVGVFVSIILISIAIGYIKKTIIINTDINIKYGYEDKSKNVIIEPQYDYAEDFYEDVAKIGFEKVFDVSIAHYHGVSNKFLYGYIRDNGEILLPPLYVELSAFDKEYAYGLKLVEVRKDKEYNELLSKYAENDDMKIFEKEYFERYKHIGLLEYLGRYQKIDRSGNVENITKEEYDKATKKISDRETQENSEILLKKDIDIKYSLRDILLDSIIPCITAIIAILIISRMIKKEEKNDRVNIM